MHWRTPGPLSDLWLRALLLRRHDAPAPRPEARGRRFQRRGTFAELFSVSNYLFSMHFFGASAVQVLVIVILWEVDSPRPHNFNYLRQFGTFVPLRNSGFW
jgi:hypothetical protein